MKSEKNINITKQKQKQLTFPVKCYLKLYQSNGLANPCANPPANYQILDQNTLLRKSEDYRNYQMLTYNKIFSARISNNLMVKHLNFIDDLSEGINHTTLVFVNSSTKKYFTTGSIQHQGAFIQYFLSIFSDCKNQYIKQSNKMYISLFSTVNNKPNHYIDLLTGQKYTFLSKKDVDSSYKTFFEKKVQSLQEYLIALKIAMIRYKECCNQKDFIVYRISIQNQDQFTQTKVASTGNVVICHKDNKYIDHFMKQTQNLLNQSHTSNITDHGSLYSFLQPYLKNGKISIINTLLNQFDQIQSNLQEGKTLLSYMNKNSFYKINKQGPIIQTFMQKLQEPNKQISAQMSTKQLSGANLKQFQKIKSVFNHYKSFIQYSTQKVQAILAYYKEISEIRQDFYEKQRFSVSLQIKNFQDSSFLIKSYYIAKIYSLSEKFQMQDIQQVCDKMMTIKNQLQISIKSTIHSIFEGKKREKQYCQQQLKNSNKSTIHLQNSGRSRLSSFKEQQKTSQRQQKYERFIKIMKSIIQKIRKKIKLILNLNVRYFLDFQHKGKQKMYKIDLLDLSKVVDQNSNFAIQHLLKSFERKDKQKSEQIHQELQSSYVFCHKLDKTDQNFEKFQNSKNLKSNHVILLNEKKKSTKPCSLLRGQKSYQKINKTVILRRHKTNLNNFETLQKSLIKIKQSQIQKDALIRQQIKKFNDKKLQNLLTKSQKFKIHHNQCEGNQNIIISKKGSQNKQSFYLRQNQQNKKSDKENIKKEIKEIKLSNCQSQMKSSSLQSSISRIAQFQRDFPQIKLQNLTKFVNEKSITKKGLKALRNKDAKKANSQQVFQNKMENKSSIILPQIKIMCCKKLIY